MALSLDKIGQAGKRKKARMKASSPSMESSPTAKATSARPKERPWSQQGLANGGRSQKERRTTDPSVNDESMGMREAPLFWVDISTKEKLADLQEKFLGLERKAVKLARAPGRILSSAKRKLRSLLT